MEGDFRVHLPDPIQRGRILYLLKARITFNLTGMKTTPACPENYHHYNGILKFRSRELRKNMTKAEKKLWQMIRNKRIHNYLFNRQRPVLNYIADFMCKELLLILEVDGEIHEIPENKERDMERESNLRAVDFTILRFKNREVLNNEDEVYRKIKEWVELRMKNMET